MDRLSGYLNTLAAALWQAGLACGEVRIVTRTGTLSEGPISPGKPAL